MVQIMSTSRCNQRCAEISANCRDFFASNPKKVPCKTNCESGGQVANMAVHAQRHQLSDHVLFEHSDKELHGIVLPDSRITAEAHVSSMEQYKQMYKRSIEKPEEFWREIAEQFYWHKPPTSFLSYNFNVQNGPIFVKWMEGAQTNICYNVLDRIVKEKNGENTVAFYWLVCFVAQL